MLRKSEEPLKKVTLNLYAADVERIRQIHPNQPLTYLRKLLRAHLVRVERSIEAGGTDLANEISLTD